MVLAGQSYLSAVVRRGSSTRRTWNDVNLSRIELILLPINLTGIHWTLFVSLKAYSCKHSRQIEFAQSKSWKISCSMHYTLHMFYIIVPYLEDIS